MRNLLTIRGAQISFYNAALAKLELPTVTLSTARVDRTGWSPEVAEQLASRGIPTDYLRVGGVHYAIIVSPLQANAPVLMPAHSFDPLCLDRFFGEAAAQVANLTERAALIVTMARNLDGVNCARDLQHVEFVSIEAADTAGVMLAARLQRGGAETIRAGDLRVFDRQFLATLVQSAQQSGDLRHEALEIPRLTFGDVRSFHTGLVAGGAWVFRDLPKGAVLTVVHECEPGEKSSTQYATLATAEEREDVLKKLVRAKLLCPTPAKYATAAARAQAMRLAILAAAARDNRPKVALAGQNEIARRRLADALNGSLPGAYSALERFASLIVGKTKDRDEAAKLVRDEGLLPWLAVPAPEVTPGTAAALNSLLAAIAPEDVLRLREYDRLSYRSARKEWPAAYTAWVDEQISLAEKAGE